MMTKLADKMKTIGSIIEKFSDIFLLIACFIIFGAFSYYSFRYTYMEANGIPFEVKDGNVIHLLLFIAILIFAVGIQFLLNGKHFIRIKEKLCRVVPILIIAGTVYVGIVSLIWVTICHVQPTGDGYVLCTVTERMLQGLYVDMRQAGYLDIFPTQYRLLFVIKIIFSVFGVWNYKVFQYINALCMPLLFYSLCQILKLIYEKSIAILYFTILFTGFLPLFLYVPYVYGEIISITFTVVLMWQAIRYCKTSKISCMIWGILAGFIACFIRQNSLIVIIAVAIVLGINAMKKTDYKWAIWILVILLLYIGSGKAVEGYYEKLSGAEVSGGVPYISWIRMGMRDNFTGPGWFDNSSVEAYASNDYDTSATAAEEKERVKDILKARISDPVGTVNFYRRKILSQWNMPTYYYIYETKVFDIEEYELTGLPKTIYYDKEAQMTSYTNTYQLILYCFVFLYAAMRFFDFRKKKPIEDNLLFIAIMGGFLFSILWESRSRYVLPYVVYSIPLAAIGLCEFGMQIKRIISKYSSTLN